MAGLALISLVLGTLAALFALISSFVSLPANTYLDRAMISLIAAGGCGLTVFVVAMGLGLRDWWKQTYAFRFARNYFLKMSNCSEAEFLLAATQLDSSLLLNVRLAISRYFNVPQEKVHRDVDLSQDLQVHKLEPAFHSSVVKFVLVKRAVELQSFAFSMKRTTSIDQLASKVQKLIDRSKDLC